MTAKNNNPTRFPACGRAGGGRLFVGVEAQPVAAGKRKETVGLLKLGGNRRSRKADKEPSGASRPDTNRREATPLRRRVCGQSATQATVSPFCSPSEEVCGMKRQRNAAHVCRGIASR